MVIIEIDNKNLHYGYDDIMKFLKKDGVKVLGGSSSPKVLSFFFENSEELRKAVEDSCVIPCDYRKIEKFSEECTHRKGEDCTYKKEVVSCDGDVIDPYNCPLH